MRARFMHPLQRHLTDTDLVRRLDDEVPEWRKADVDRHLLGCETCRARQHAIQETASTPWSEYRTKLGPDLVSVEQSRARLQSRLICAGGRAGGSWSVVSDLLMGSTRAMAAVAMVVIVGFAACAFNRAP